MLGKDLDLQAAHKDLKGAQSTNLLRKYQLCAVKESQKKASFTMFLKL